MKIQISKVNGEFVVDAVELPGSPSIGRGGTMMEAIGRFFHAHQKTFGVEFEVDPSAQMDEAKRRDEALSQR